MSGGRGSRHFLRHRIRIGRWARTHGVPTPIHPYTKSFSVDGGRAILVTDECDHLRDHDSCSIEVVVVTMKHHREKDLLVY